MATKLFETNMALETKFTKDIKSILGNQFIIKDIQQDLKHGTDFMVLKMTPFRIACRLRRNKYYKYYSNEFTIRWSNPNGYKTEYQKIMECQVDFLFYGFLDETELKIIDYFIGDLNIFRNSKLNKCPVIKKNCYPDYNELAIYNKNDFPREFILKQYTKKPVPPLLVDVL